MNEFMLSDRTITKLMLYISEEVHNLNPANHDTIFTL